MPFEPTSMSAYVICLCFRIGENTWQSQMQEDVYNPHTWLQECLSDCLYSFGEPLLTRWPISYMRKKALQQVAEFLKYEDENSQYICIGAAQKVG